MSGPHRKMTYMDGDEFLSSIRCEILEHGGVVRIVDDLMGIDMAEKSVDAYLLRAIYHELRQMNITLNHIRTSNREITLDSSG